MLVAGVGNVLRGDDGFGPAVIQTLNSGSVLPAGVRVTDVGIGGINLVHELMAGYDALVIVDAVERGGGPGTLYVLEPLIPALASLAPMEQRELAADMHGAIPARALLIAGAAGVLPPVVRMIGCQPSATEEFSLELSSLCRRAVAPAADAVRALLAEWLGSGAMLEGSGQHGRCA